MRGTPTYSQVNPQKPETHDRGLVRALPKKGMGLENSATQTGFGQSLRRERTRLLTAVSNAEDSLASNGLTPGEMRTRIDELEKQVRLQTLNPKP